MIRRRIALLNNGIKSLELLIFLKHARNLVFSIKTILRKYFINYAFPLVFLISPRRARYASVMEYLRPEEVLSKDRTLKAYPVGGEFIIDIDAYMNFQKHRHRTEPEGFCFGCLEQAKELTLKLLGVGGDQLR